AGEQPVRSIEKPVPPAIYGLFLPDRRRARSMGTFFFRSIPPNRPIKRPPASGEWIRTFAIITTDCNELVADIHDRMPVILAPSDYARWLGEEPDPIDAAVPGQPDANVADFDQCQQTRERRLVNR